MPGVVLKSWYRSKALMSQWYRTYEKLCQKGVVRKVRETIVENKEAVFLIEDLPMPHRYSKTEN